MPIVHLILFAAEKLNMIDDMYANGPMPLGKHPDRIDR
jgi:hypothetical protein